MKIAWLTDIHLNFVSPDTWRKFVRSIRIAKPDAVLISGDIGEAQSVCSYLADLDAALQIPIYFVLGNHDFYNGSIARVRQDVQRLVSSGGRMIYLSVGQVVELTKTTALVGHDGWADTRFGDFNNSGVILNDYLLIRELRPKGLHGHFGPRPKSELVIILQRLAAEAATHFEACLNEALTSYDNVIAVTHVPPFREACWYGSHISDDSFLPHFSSKVVGDVMAAAMKRHPNKNLTVLCGHTHGSGTAQILPNLEVLTGGATYGEPAVSRIIEIQ